MKTYEGVDVYTQAFLTSALAGGEWSATRPGRFNTEERATITHFIGGWVGPRTGLKDVEKILAPTGTQTPDPSVIQPVACRYTDCAQEYKQINKSSRTIGVPAGIRTRYLPNRRQKCYCLSQVV
jgi:hypothetical protein